MARSEEEKVINLETNKEVLTAYSRIPYALINSEIEGDAKDVLDDLTQICRYYKIYKEGKDFTVEGTNGDYVPATLHYKMVASLIDKEARFLFAESPDVKIEAKGDVGKVSEESKDALTTLNDVIKTIMDENRFEKILLQAAKDCFIGKRIAGMVNFNEEDGVTITFLPSTQFIYELKPDNPNVVQKFVAFIIFKESRHLNEKRIFKKKYELEDGKVYLEEEIYDGTGVLVEEVTTRQPIQLSRIPVSIFLNDGLTGDEDGESEIEILKDYEFWYSKLSNADIDSERKSMNPTRYAVDMDSRSTKNLSSSAGSFWDLMSDQNLDHPNPMIGVLESNMNYSDTLRTSLDRIKTTAYEQIDMPNITLESLQGAITSGKALKAIYWPLIVRCKEKMKMWGPQLRLLFDIVIEGTIVYPNCFKEYTSDPLLPVAYELTINQNTPLPEDEIEEKTINIAEVQANVISRKRYMQTWYNLTDDEVTEELKQIALEREMVEESYSTTGMFGDGDDSEAVSKTENLENPETFAGEETFEEITESASTVEEV